MEIFDRYPELTKQFKVLCRTRCNEILSHMVESDSEYEQLRCKRANTSMALKESIDCVDIEVLFEEYSDSLYAQEIYELDIIYKQAFYDVLNLLKEQGLI